MLAILLAVLGFLQIGFRRWIKGETSRFLFWMFLLLCLGLAFDYWTFAIATRFWTLTIQMQSDQVHRAYEISRMLAGYFLKLIVALGLLNIGLALLRQRSSRPVPG
jgi:Sec-independent protein secretion pathway component TatC